VGMLGNIISTPFIVYMRYRILPSSFSSVIIVKILQIKHQSDSEVIDEKDVTKTQQTHLLALIGIITVPGQWKAFVLLISFFYH
jgi:hypothetical protein